MKKTILIVSYIVLCSIWSDCEALCVEHAQQNMQQQAETMAGILTIAGLPCTSDENSEYPCIPCVTLAFFSNNILYYLTSDNEYMLKKLNEVEQQWSKDTIAFITGIPYIKGNANYINVQEINIGNPTTQATTWHCVSVYRSDFDSNNVSYSSITYQLKGDTLFGDIHYKTLRSEDGTYWGAVRKTDDGKQVYFRPGEGGGKFPASLGKEYLLYDFGVKEGDTTCVYNGFMDTADEEIASIDSNWPVMDSVIVISVQMIDGRKHVLAQQMSEPKRQNEWIEGIGTRNILFCNDRNRYAGNNYGLYTLCAADSEGNIIYSFDTDYLGIHNDCPNWTPLAVDNITTNQPSASKHLRDGMLLIKKNDKLYNAQGVEIK